MVALPPSRLLGVEDSAKVSDTKGLGQHAVKAVVTEARKHRVIRVAAGDVHRYVLPDAADVTARFGASHAPSDCQIENDDVERFAAFLGGAEALDGDLAGRCGLGDVA